MSGGTPRLDASANAEQDPHCITPSCYPTPTHTPARHCILRPSLAPRRFPLRPSERATRRSPPARDLIPYPTARGAPIDVATKCAIRGHNNQVPALKTVPAHSRLGPSAPAASSRCAHSQPARVPRHPRDQTMLGTNPLDAVLPPTRCSAP
ncbi:hypothetical protein C8J57DRAFT_1515439 [Mycena rebaudengoi]|nr:hypothetical protein C8J57DRAFT_1515439 [Mycena rebaudengoi]